ncbi:MAG: winged helix-turn-helix transcriptional regulator [Ferrovum sp.]|nr:winged helix-turn-helix transcriptional regulator [Ferrovum sp.]
MNRDLKDLLYELVAHVGKAVSSPKRLELLELLAQGEKTVEELAKEISVDVRLASAHLKSLKAARLVTSRRNSKHMVYQLSGSDVAGLWPFTIVGYRVATVQSSFNFILSKT